MALEEEPSAATSLAAPRDAPGAIQHARGDVEAGSTGGSGGTSRTTPRRHEPPTRRRRRPSRHSPTRERRPRCLRGRSPPGDSHDEADRQPQDVDTHPHQRDRRDQVHTMPHLVRPALATRVGTTRDAGANAKGDILAFIDVYRMADRGRAAQVLSSGGVVRSATPGRTTSARTRCRPFVTLEWDGDVEVFRVSAGDVAAEKGVTMLDHASPLGRALGDARQGASISWASPGGPQTADVLQVAAPALRLGRVGTWAYRAHRSVWGPRRCRARHSRRSSRTERRPRPPTVPDGFGRVIGPEHGPVGRGPFEDGVLLVASRKVDEGGGVGVDDGEAGFRPGGVG